MCSGTGGEGPAATRAGAKHVHQFTCLADCSLYDYSDGAFDIHYVDPSGGAITPADAFTAAHMKSPVAKKP